MKRPVFYFLMIGFCAFVFSGSEHLFAGTEFDSWLNRQKSSFESYRDKRDKEFVGYLKEDWKKFRVSTSMVRDSVPKPDSIPVFSPDGEEADLPEPVKDKTASPHIEPDVEPDGERDILPPEPPADTKPVPAEKPPYDEIKGKRITAFKFFGTDVTLHTGTIRRFQPVRKLNPESISAFWENMSKSDYEPLVSELLEYKKTLVLNDWGYHRLVYETGFNMFQDRNMASLFVWFISSKSGFRSKPGYDKTTVFMMFPSENSLYGTPFLTINGEKYYVLDFRGDTGRKPDSILTYEGRYPQSDRIMDFTISASPDIGSYETVKTLRFGFKGRTYEITASVNRHLIDFYKHYPQTSLDVYFDAVPSDDIRQLLADRLRPHLDGRDEKEAVLFLLRFVQTAFAYKTDDMQFGHEKYMLPEETVYYPYSDCEDRAFLFAYLVKRLLGLDVIGLSYPGHVATGVCFSKNVSGDAVLYDKKMFIVCDPTYINADVGMTMAEFRKFSPVPVAIRPQGKK